MYREEIDHETLIKVKSFERLTYDAYIELINQKVLKRIKKLRSRRTIFFDQETKVFLYLNPYSKNLNVCAVFTEDYKEEVSNG